MSTFPIDFVLLIPCYNNKEGLYTSLKSVQYPKEKCEVLIVDDGSSPALFEEELRREIPMLYITLIRLEKNQGIVNALNTGLVYLEKRKDINYIARLDVGDTCDPERFSKQIKFMNTHPDIALLATWARFQNPETGKSYDYITKTTHNKILKEMHYKCSFIHPSVMFRKELLIEGFYPTNYPHAEDYAFFWKILKSHKGAVLPEKLVKITFSDKNISSSNYKNQLRSRKRIVKTYGNNRCAQLRGIIELNIKLFIPQRLILLLK